MNRDNVVSYYDVLEVSKHATQAEIQESYRRLALRYHPDKNARTRRLAALRFKMIAEAYSALNTPEKRARYDLEASVQDMRAINTNMPLGVLSKVMDLFRQEDGTKT